MRALLALAALLAPVALAAQEMDEADGAAAKAAREAQRRGAYLAADAALRTRAFDAAGKPRPGFVHDQWAELQGVLTGVPAARAWLPGVTAAKADPADPGVARIGAAVPRDAIAAIVARARSTRVVILNEDHASPRDRAFGLEVARALRPLGYTLFGAETFTNSADRARADASMAALAKDGYPRRDTGYYTRDPVFGDFVRQSLALGYRPFAYESTDYGPETDWKARIARREENQASAIVRVLRENPEARLFVYVGFSHATERPLNDGDGGEPTHWMATRLKAMSGIDPLTIDQTILNDSGSGQPALHALVAGKLGERPAVLFDGSKPLVLGQYRGAVDLQVAHPPLKRVHGRPDWLARLGRTPTPIPTRYLPANGTRLVQAFVAGEAEDAIPVDQVLVTAGEAPPMLMLPKAPVRYAVQDAGDERIATATPRDAITAIAERAKATRVVILNEDHASPRNRGFALEVARALRPLGYTMLGAETFTTNPNPVRRAADMARLKRDGYPRQDTGYYTTDPVFGDFIRQALALGYTPFAYEESGPELPGDQKAQIARREAEQAENIARILAENPSAKLFVYAGFHHATEQPIRYPDPAEHTPWMATRLKALTGIDPLTIDQTVLNDGPAGEAALVAAAGGKLGGRPGMLFDGDRPLVLRRFAGAVDLQVAHPPARLVGGRPDWLARMGRKPTAVPAQYLPATGTRIVRAFVASEAADAIPIDEVRVTAGEAPPMLMLPDAPVRYAVADAG